MSYLQQPVSGKHAIAVREQVRLTFENIRFGWLGIFVVAGFTMYAMQDYREMPDWWILATSIVAVWHGVFVTRFLSLDRKQCIQNYVRWGYGMTVLSLVAGGLASLGVCLAMDFDRMQWSYFLIAMLIMPGFGSAVTSAGFQPIHIAWVFGSQLPLGVFLLASTEPTMFIMGAGVLLGAIPTMLIFGYGYGKIYKRNIALHIENDDLLQELQEKVKAELKANCDKSRFLAATSHDLRQPLHALDLFLGSLKSRLRITEELKLLEQAQASSRALRELLNSLLDISHLDAGEVRVEKKRVPLVPIIQECCSEFQPVAEAKGLQLRLRTGPGCCVDTDPVLFARMLRNLIANAICYTDQGNILVGVRQRGAMVRIEVWDTGRGIASDMQEHIFDEFYQIDNPERDREKGLGLGLAIVRRLSGLLGTPVGFCSKYLRGSCFHVSVPVCDVFDLCVTPDESEVYEPSLSGLFILVIDDNRPILDGMRELLRDWECEVLLGQGSEAILDELRQYHYPVPDVLLVDFRLRGHETGDMAVRAIREFFGVEIPAIITTGEATKEVEETLLRMNAQFIQKPVETHVLKNILFSMNQEMRSK